MVMSNMGLPEPPNSETTITANNELIIPTESDSEDDEDGAAYSGYEPLPMNPINEPASDNESDEDDESAEIAKDDNEIEPMDVSLSRDVWSASVSKDIEMDSDKVNLVKEAMVNFQLPASNIPEWANNIPEDEWKEHIFRRLENK